jgi:hypothetical protein
MEEFENDPHQDLAELAAVLHQLVKRMTKRLFATPRMMQMDVGRALSLLNRVHYPKRLFLRRALSDLLRELGKRRPDLHRYVVTLEEAAREMDEELEKPEWQRE